MANNENYINDGHVYYFEPNDLEFGTDQNNDKVALMPHLEDMCIAMSLSADIYPREKTCIPSDKEMNTAEMVTKQIAWISYINSGTRLNLVNDGLHLGNDNFLTTYYTEISADKYIENELVEGLGVTGVTISFESWYTPTITINFVDVHGSALWGREEAIHDNGEINGSNILGVFFTQPYPLFRLQVKGFLGQAVTYQLSVSSFKGKYNSQTGNFEATATFIGYSYSLLTDIPLEWLKYVSENDYVGKSYWNDHVNSPSWQLINSDGSTHPPIPLYRLIENIRSAIGSMDSIRNAQCDGSPDDSTSVDSGSVVTSSVENGQKVSLADAYTVSNANNERNDIYTLKNSLNEFVKSCKDFCLSHGGQIYEGDSEEETNKQKQILFIFGRGGQDETRAFNVKYNMQVAYHNFVKAVDEYNNANPNDKFENYFEKNMPFDFHKKAMESPKGAMSIVADKAFVNYNNGRVAQRHVPLTVGGVSVFKSIESHIDNNLQIRASKANPEPFGEYAFLLTLGTMSSTLDAKITHLESLAHDISVKTENKIAMQSNSAEAISNVSSDDSANMLQEIQRKKVIEFLGFEPTIGNFVKLLMCHLETFAEIMFKCAENIYNERNNRLPSSLGVNLSATDIPPYISSPTNTATNSQPKWIYPWPALYKPSNVYNSETPSNGKDGLGEILAWPNDYKANAWEEQLVIEGFWKAMTRVKQLIENSEPQLINNAFTSIPMSGLDLTLLNSPFYLVADSCHSVGDLAGYLGLRAAQIIGVGNSNCTPADAEIIGSIDALNFLKSFSQTPDKLRALITSINSSSFNFEQEAIDYMTCKKFNLSTSSGNQYNNFETADRKTNFYDANYHPIFHEDGTDKYDYSYTYTENVLNNGDMVSVVPTRLHSFANRNNPYIKLLIPEHKTISGTTKTVYIPQISKKDTEQCWVYTTKSPKVHKDITHTNYGYANSQLFTVITNDILVRNLMAQICSLDRGALKINDYTVPGSDSPDKTVEHFIDRHYKTLMSDYANYYPDDKGCHMISTVFNKIDRDYMKDHLCMDNSRVDVVKLDDRWCYNTSSDLYNKMTYKKDVQRDAFTYKDYEGKSVSLDSFNVIDLPLIVNNSDVVSLFGSEIYYLQNDIEDVNISRLAKAYLILNSMMAGIDPSKVQSLFKYNGSSRIESMPPFYVLFIGALIWRYDFCSNNADKDVSDINFGTFAKPDWYHSLVNRDKKMMSVSPSADVSRYYKLGDYFIPFENIDIAVRNTLIDLFKQYALGSVFTTITQLCELRKNGNEFIGKETWATLREEWSKSDFDSSNPSHWTALFGDMFDKYCSVALPSNKMSLRLLFNENNTLALSYLNGLYGLTTPFIVSRATTQHVGEDEKGKVTISRQQLTSYLTGFKRRVEKYLETYQDKIQQTSGSGVSVVDRDIAIGLYYSLKHLWDTWLITAVRNQFTIDEFFNKYFVFIDSFYANVYNEIKLNAEHIEKAASNPDASLFTFMENVTSEAGCMLFALPDFLDSNVYNNSTVQAYAARNNNNSDFSWKRDDLLNMFKPIPYNEMNQPQLYNVFVFIYTHPFSNNALESTDLKFDSYMMNDVNSRPKVLSVATVGNLKVTSDGFLDATNNNIMARPNNTIPLTDEQLVSGRYAYMMPCFGITVNRGNNYIFKSINVSMDSPKQTAISAQTLANIYTKAAADGSKRIYFHGQDIYSVYAQYAYACEIEMLGCAQLQPLMYFQLLNIPMWRGTYMIYKVTHTLSPGNMTTKFTGMKMSRYQAPFATGYYTIPIKNN